jgi:glycine amidinotransferase
MNIGNKNHELGTFWLQSILGKDYKIHKVRLTDSHIDGLIVPIAEGVLLTNPIGMKNKYHLLPEFLQKWKRIEVCDEYKEFDYPKNHLQLSSFRGMDTNVLAIGNKKVLIRDTAIKTIQKLKNEGFIPIPVQLRHCELFGGAFHCITLDTIRD